jgi:hypothetical protein
MEMEKRSMGARSCLVAMSLLLAACGGAEAPVRSSDPIPPSISTPEVSSPEVSIQPFYSTLDDIEIIVPFGEGGYADVAARFIAASLQPHIPGGASINVVNIAEDGGNVGTNEFANERAADGMTLLLTRESTFIAQAFGGERVRYDVRDWTPLFSVPAGAVTYVRVDTGITEVLDLVGFGGTLRYGGRDPSRTDHLLELLAFDLLGINYDATWGYASNAESRNAFTQGELDLRASAERDELGLSGFAELVVPLFSLGQMTPDGIVRDPLYPHLPHPGEVYEQIFGVNPTQGSPDLWRHFLGVLRAQYGAKTTIWVKNGTPVDAVRDLQAAVVAMSLSEAFISSRESVLGPYEPEVDPVVLTDPTWAASLVPDAATVEFIVRYRADRSGTDSR